MELASLVAELFEGRASVTAFEIALAVEPTVLVGALEPPVVDVEPVLLEPVPVDPGTPVLFEPEPVLFVELVEPAPAELPGVALEPALVEPVELPLSLSDALLLVGVVLS